MTVVASMAKDLICSLRQAKTREGLGSGFGVLGFDKDVEGLAVGSYRDVVRV